MMNLIKFLRDIIRTHDDQYVSHGDDPRAIILDEMVALEDGEDFTKEQVADSILGMFDAAGLEIVPKRR